MFGLDLEKFLIRKIWLVLLAHMKDHIETSLMQVTVCLYHVRVRFYRCLKLARKSPTFFVYALDTSSMSQKMRKKILVYSCLGKAR